MPLKTHIAIVSRLRDEERKKLMQRDDIVLEFYSDRRDALAKEGSLVEIAYGNVREFELPHLPNLKWLCTTWAGVDNLCYPAMIEKNLIITNVRGAQAGPMAEHALAGLLYFLRDIPAHLAANEKKSWRRPVDCRLLSGETIAVLGTGGMGRKVIETFSALGCRVFGVNSTGKAVRGAAETFDLETVKKNLHRINHLVLCLPSTPKTFELIDESWLSALLPGAVIINIGRGTALKNEDLLSAIKTKQIRGAVLDVSNPEPLPETSDLWNCPEILITGHMSSAPGNKNDNPAFEAFEKNLDLYLAGKTKEMINQVDLKKGY